MCYKSLPLVFMIAALSFGQNTETHHEHHMSHDEEDVSMEVVGMPSAIFLGIPMSMDGSGTSWLPENNNASMHMVYGENWMGMYHGNIFLRYTKQGGKRGGEQFSFPNWFMASAQRNITDNQQIAFRGMVSLDRLVDGGNGYPLLLQSGETWNGQSLVDRQHPHDLFAELSATYSISFGHEIGSYLYLGYPGEPAMGPPVFMHRPSSQFNPDAPIGHHWQDATHITFGVATVGFVLKNVKIEGSLFTGREPDENRYNFDKPRFDSYSGRVSYNPTSEFALQVSYGFINDPEGHGDDVNRISASALYSTTFNDDESIHASAVFGQNEDHHVQLNSYLLEAAYINGNVGLYGRHEIVEKPRFDLGIFIDKEKSEAVRQYTAGINYQIVENEQYSIKASVQGMVSAVSTFLESYYGKNPVSVQVYIQVQ